MAVSEHRNSIAELEATIMRPGLIWGCVQAAGETRLVEECDDEPDASFRWLHLNLADQRSQRWIERSCKLPHAIRELMLSHDAHPRAVVQDGVAGLVIHDFERDFDRMRTDRVGSLHMALGPSLMLTGRYHPLHSADVIKQRLSGRETVADAPDALDHLLRGVIDTIASIALDVTADLVAAEDGFLTGEHAPDMRELVDLRRRGARLHRMMSGMRSALHRLEGDPHLPKPLRPVVAGHAQRLHALDADIVSVQAQLRLLRDELDLQAAQRTNQNIYLLSVMTALMLPATLVTGFFGMNTGGLPLVEDGGTLIATLAALTASTATYFLLRWVGLVRG